MRRQVVCPFTATFKSPVYDGNGVRVNAVGGPVPIHRAGSCLIPPNGTACFGKIPAPEEDLGEMVLDKFSTADSLLVDDEVRQGAVRVADTFPEIKSGDNFPLYTEGPAADAFIIHRYVFPRPHNPYHNYEKPCDANNDQFVNALDPLSIRNFVFANGGRINLTTFESKGKEIRFIDVNNDWWADMRDVQRAIECTNQGQVKDSSPIRPMVVPEPTKLLGDAN